MPPEYKYRRHGWTNSEILEWEADRDKRYIEWINTPSLKHMAFPWDMSPRICSNHSLPSINWRQPMDEYLSNLNEIKRRK